MVQQKSRYLKNCVKFIQWKPDKRSQKVEFLLEVVPMSIAQVFLNSMSANPTYLNPQVKTDVAASIQQISQDTNKTTQAAKSDTVTISAQALQKLASDGDSQAKETKESGAEKATETFRGVV
jgi:hypothetical protein